MERLHTGKFENKYKLVIWLKIFLSSIYRDFVHPFKLIMFFLSIKLDWSTYFVKHTRQQNKRVVDNTGKFEMFSTGTFVFLL